MPKQKTAKIDMIVRRAGDRSMIHSARTDYNMAHAGSTAEQVVQDLVATRSLFESTLIDASNITNDQLEDYGRLLASTLLSGDISELYSKAANGNRVQLGICIDDPALKAIPWEFLHWPDVRSAPHPNRCVARLVPGTDIKPLVPLKLAAGGRILLAVSAPSDHSGVDWVETEREMSRIFSANTPEADLKRIDFKLVEAATADSLRKAVQEFDPHIVHFIGHGHPEGLLFLKHRSNVGKLIPTHALRNVLASDSTRLVILSACDTANVGTDIAPLVPLAERLVQAGVPAVVANQMPMSLRSVATFCGAVYSTILHGGDVDWAVNNGRIAVGVAFAEIDAATIEWGVPVLYRRPGCSQLFAAG